MTMPINRLAVGAVMLSLTSVAVAQDVVRLPDAASQLVVRVEAFPAEGQDADQIGAGIVLDTKDRIVIATAAHVIRGTEAGGRITVVFSSHRKDTLEATVGRADNDLDLAIITVDRKQAPPVAFSFDRMGNPRTLKPGDPVIPIGCPQSACWAPGVSPDRLITIRGRDVVFESFFVDPGSSGGALFNRHGEVIGLVTIKEDPRGMALAIQDVATKAVEWGYRVELHERKVPRAGYATRVSLTALGSTSDGVTQSGRWPGGRAAVLFRGQKVLGWHLSGLRLAPENLAVTGFLGGLDLRLQKGRFAVTPFGEMGFARVEGRFDAGGYFVQPSTGSPKYLPYWNTAQDDVIGYGGGVSLDLLLFPHVAIEGLVAHWEFSLPTQLESVPTLFMGAGLRFAF
jgi:hypothetical protein